MHCVGWASLLLLLCSRRASCLVVRAFGCQQQSGYLRQPLHNCNVREYRSSSSPSHSHLLGTTHAESLGLGRRQVLCSGSGGSSGSSPDLDAITADTSLGDATATTTAVGSDLNLFSGMELALDALGASTQWVVAGAVGVALVTRTDVTTLVYVVGSLLNAVFSKVLKKTINQVRPDGAQLSDPGMPSSHAMSLFYLGTYLVIGLEGHGMLALDPSLPQWPLDVTQTQTVLGMYAVAASLWRVKAGFHTLPQVSVGAAIGAVDAVLWYHFCQIYFSSRVEAFFGGPDIPVELAIGVCVVTFFTFGNAQRKIAQVLSRNKDA